MLDFLTALQQHTFLQYALATGLLASIASGVVGSYVVVRRISYIAGAIAHCVFGGVGFAQYLQVAHGLTWADPLLGAVASALAAALIIGVVSLRAHEREDTIIGVVWAVGMALGFLFVKITPGYPGDPMRYLFGDILLVRASEIYMLAALDVVVVAVGLLFYNQLTAVCFDEEFARLRGVNVEFYYLLLLCLTALTVVLLLFVVGVVLVIALLTLPVAAAGFGCRTLWQLMIASAVLTALLSTAGVALSYTQDAPAGPIIIVLAGGVYVLFAAMSAVIARLRTA